MDAVAIMTGGIITTGDGDGGGGGGETVYVYVPVPVVTPEFDCALDEPVAFSTDVDF